MSFELMALPYAEDALEPHISANTMSFHYGKHHKGYVDKMNDAINGTDMDGMSLEEVIAKAKKDGNQGLFNSAAQTWNHDFFWKSMSPGSTAPSGDLAAAIDKAFGGVEEFGKAFKTCATGQFGSGWAWLVADGDGLAVMGTANADLPLVQDKTALLTCDVWEHAYYLDYQNKRDAFVDVFLNNLINWDFAQENWENR